MNRYHLLIVSLITALGVVTTYSQQTSTNAWHPDTRLLDLSAKDYEGSDASTLAHDVERFYQLLRDKKWPETYELRAKCFREASSESDYLADAKKYGKLWGLSNYDVLSVSFQKMSGSDIDVAILICRFTELPDNAVSYSTVYWHREDGVWKCLSAGPSNLPIFEGTREPYVDWR